MVDPRSIGEAERALQAGEFELALQHYSHALAREPSLPDAWFNTGWLHSQLGDYDQALAAYANALTYGIARREDVHLNRAAILSEYRHDTAGAERELRAAIGANPKLVGVWHGLGTLHEDRGSVAEAHAAYQEALRCDPGDGRAHARLAAIQTAQGEAGAAVAALERALSSVSTIESRAEILFALGAALDAQGNYDRAFQAFEAANWLAKSSMSSPYDAAAHADLVDQLIATNLPPPLSSEPSDAPSPIFICGMFRSGSTLTEAIIGRHSAVTAGGELPFFPHLIRTRLRPYPASLPGLSLADRVWLHDAYANRLSAIDSRARYVTDKRCDNFVSLGLIQNLFPASKVVHTYRNPLDNVLSVYFLFFGKGVSYGSDLRDAAHYYVQYNRLMTHWQRRFPQTIFDFDYDGLVAQPRKSVVALLSSLDLEWEEVCLTPPSSGQAVRTPSSAQVRQPLHQRSSGRWRHYEPQLQPAIDILLAAGIVL